MDRVFEHFTHTDCRTRECQFASDLGPFQWGSPKNICDGKIRAKIQSSVTSQTSSEALVVMLKCFIIHIAVRTSNIRCLHGSFVNFSRYLATHGACSDFLLVLLTTSDHLYKNTVIFRLEAATFFPRFEPCGLYVRRCS